MLALRDQENLVHAHQTTAAAKPLNQGTRGLQPKTPGLRNQKTPFKIPLNDENNAGLFGKKGKGNDTRNENTIKPGKDAFVTPLGPRNRAPLGMKTTNAKAKGLQTPAPPAETVKKTNKRGSTGQKAKKAAPVVQPSKTELLDSLTEDDIPDIEYMPPKPQELPDFPDDITYDTTFPQFQGNNIARGWERVYSKEEIGPDGLTKRERKFQEDSIAYDKMVDEMIQKQVDDMPLLEINTDEFLDQPGIEQQREEECRAKEEASKKKYARSVSTRSISTLKSREAATALSRPSSLSKGKSAPAPKSRPTSALSTRSKKTPAPTNPSSMRHTAAAASSRTTVGYSKGRSVSSSLKGKTAKPDTTRPPSSSILSPATYTELYGPPPVGSEMWMRCKTAEYCTPDEPEEEVEEIPPFYEEDEETQNFQLTL
ncbi:hypothetical protein Plec18167_009517 [Paecilomyces lecythidis]|uniref:Uncharacterized protein n=1 Tax=Paecilomyces lecythidis TaxID=3004212 RepID=A0ABR3WNL5_9EURO